MDKVGPGGNAVKSFRRIPRTLSSDGGQILCEIASTPRGALILRTQRAVLDRPPLPDVLLVASIDDAFLETHDPRPSLR